MGFRHTSLFDTTTTVRVAATVPDQTTAAVLMIRPAAFGFNEQTAASNAFQKHLKHLPPEEILARSVSEFNGFVARLVQSGIRVEVFDDTPHPQKPDALFPNNWMSTHVLRDGTRLLLTYPMLTPNRRKERRSDIIGRLVSAGYVHNNVLERHESSGKYLEGTGSIVFDHPARRAYAVLSPRTNPEVLEELCTILDYKPEVFSAFDGEGMAIYHTNVVMTIGEGFAVLGTETITDPGERRRIVARLRDDGHEVTDLTQEQVSRFAGNMLQLGTSGGKHCLAMSETAFGSLSRWQQERLGAGSGNEIVQAAIPTIETIGGGSARCMMAELF